MPILCTPEFGMSFYYYYLADAVSVVRFHGGDDLLEWLAVERDAHITHKKKSPHPQPHDGDDDFHQQQMRTMRFAVSGYDGSLATNGHESNTNLETTCHAERSETSLSFVTRIRRRFLPFADSGSE
jgi:hypothetical protein